MLYQNALAVTLTEPAKLKSPLKTNTQSPPSGRSKTSEKTFIIKLIDSRRARSASKSLQAISVNYIVIILSVCLSEAVTVHSRAVIAWCIYAFAALIISSRLRGFENLVHEASHHNLFPSIEQHYLLEPLYAYPVFRDVYEYRTAHLQHHKHLGDPSRDPDAQRLIELGFDELPSRPTKLLFGLPASGYLTYEYLKTTFTEFWASKHARTAKTIFWMAVLALFWLSDAMFLLLWYYAVPMLLVLPMTRFWAEAAEHAGLDMRGTLGNSRSNNGNFHRWYMHPHNDGFHAVHHLSPQVPFHALPEAHNFLMRECEAYRTQTVVSNGFWESMKQMCARKTVFQDVSAR